MSDEKPSFTLHETVGGFLIQGTDREGSPSELRLTASDLFSLVQSAQILTDRILLKMRERSGSRVPALKTDIADVRLDRDPLTGEVRLALVGPSDAVMTFNLSDEAAQNLVERLTVELVQAAAAKPSIKQ